MQRFFLVFLGQVQGVGFRASLMMLSSKYNVTGWVRNRYDGSVECQLQGERVNINKIINELSHSTRYVHIEDYSIKEIPIEPNETQFKIKG